MKKEKPLLLLLLIFLLLLIGVMAFFVMRTPTVHTVSGTVATNPSLEPSSAEASTEQTTEASTEPATEVTTEAPTSPYDNKLVITATQFLNIREAPDTSAKVLGKIYHGSIADVLEQQDGFSRITSGDVTGWVSNDYVIFGAEAESYIAENGTFTATVTVESLNVREKPDTTSRVLASVEEGQVFIVSEQLDGWVKIYYTTDIVGYLSVDYVTVELSQGKAISAEEEQELIGMIKPTEPPTTKAPETTKAPSTTKAPATTKASGSSNQTTAAPTTTPATTSAAETTKGDGEVVADDLQLLAALVQAEAGYNYEACLGVANVVLNRVNSSSYPNTIRDVIYQKNQFSPVASGYLDKILQNGPAKVALTAAADALNGITNLDHPYVRFIGASLADRDSYSKYIELGGNVFYEK